MLLFPSGRGFFSCGRGRKLYELLGIFFWVPAAKKIYLLFHRHILCRNNQIPRNLHCRIHKFSPSLTLFHPCDFVKVGLNIIWKIVSWTCSYGVQLRWSSRFYASPPGVKSGSNSSLPCSCEFVVRMSDWISTSAVLL